MELKLACKPTSNPIELNHKLGEAREDPVVDKEMYQHLVGKLIYLAHNHPNIAYSVSVISQFMHDPREAHLQSVQSTPLFKRQSSQRDFIQKKCWTLEAYTDADNAGSPVDIRYTSGYCTFLGGNLVTWRSKKQNVVARSSAESEFTAMRCV